MQFYAFIEVNYADKTRQKYYWNRKAQAWDLLLDINCAFPTARGAARRANLWAKARKEARDFGEFAFGFAVYTGARA